MFIISDTANDDEACAFKTQRADGCAYAALILRTQSQKHILSKKPCVMQRR